MNDFTYSRAQNVKEAFSQLRSKSESRFIAGGTNLLDLMKEGTARASHLVDINHLGLKKIEPLENGGWRLGALATNAETAYHPEIQKRYPLLSQAILAAASPQLRNMATNGGNLLQRTRCYYFYDVGTPCNKRSPGAGCGALKGVNRIHAILGASENCIAVHPSDMAVALAALEATVHVTGPKGDRSIPIADFHRLPGSQPERDNTLGDDEIITSIDLPREQFADHSAYVKARERNSYAFALASAAVGLSLKEGRIESARIALGGVAHKPWRREESENYLKGREGTREDFTRAAELLLSGARGYGHNDFKIELAKRVILRAGEEAMAGGNKQ
jgi:xanthine dehydrogenase YagS FAD-binding subunit